MLTTHEPLPPPGGSIFWGVQCSAVHVRVHVMHVCRPHAHTRANTALSPQVDLAVLYCSMLYCMDARMCVYVCMHVGHSLTHESTLPRPQVDPAAEEWAARLTAQREGREYVPSTPARQLVESCAKLLH